MLELSRRLGLGGIQDKRVHRRCIMSRKRILAVMTLLTLLVLLSTSAQAGAPPTDCQLVWGSTSDFPCEDRPLMCWASTESGTGRTLYNIKRQRCDLGAWIGPVSWTPGWTLLCVQEWKIYTCPGMTEEQFCTVVTER